MHVTTCNPDHPIKACESAPASHFLCLVPACILYLSWECLLLGWFIRMRLRQLPWRPRLKQPTAQHFPQKGIYATAKRGGTGGNTLPTHIKHP